MVSVMAPGCRPNKKENHPKWETMASNLNVPIILRLNPRLTAETVDGESVDGRNIQPHNTLHAVTLRGTSLGPRQGVKAKANYITREGLSMCVHHLILVDLGAPFFVGSRGYVWRGV